MPRGKKMQTPIKEPEISSMTHEEGEEMLHDISKLQDQVQKMSASQKLTKPKINGMESKIKGVEAKMDNWKTDLKTDMDELKINMNTLLQEMVTKGERVVKETHDENKRNVNHDYIDSNVGS